MGWEGELIKTSTPMSLSQNHHITHRLAKRRRKSACLCKRLITPIDRIYLYSSCGKICLTPWRKQEFVHTFIWGSSTIFFPCCNFTQRRAHLFSSTEWHMQRQHQLPGSYGCRVVPVNPNEARKTMTTNKNLRFTRTTTVVLRCDVVTKVTEVMWIVRRVIRSGFAPPPVRRR